VNYRGFLVLSMRISTIGVRPINELGVVHYRLANMLPETGTKKWRADLRAQCALADPGGERVVGCHSLKLGPTGVCTAERYTPLHSPAHKEPTLGLSGSVRGGVCGRFSYRKEWRVGMVRIRDLGGFFFECWAD